MIVTQKHRTAQLPSAKVWERIPEYLEADEVNAIIRAAPSPKAKLLICSNSGGQGCVRYPSCALEERLEVRDLSKPEHSIRPARTTLRVRHQVRVVKTFRTGLCRCIRSYRTRVRKHHQDSQRSRPAHLLMGTSLRAESSVRKPGAFALPLQSRCSPHTRSDLHTAMQGRACRRGLCALGEDTAQAAVEG